MMKHYEKLEALGFTWERPSQPEEENRSDEEKDEEDAPIFKAALYSTSKPLNEMQRRKEEEYTALWEERYLKLKAFKDEHGHCTVGRSHDKTLSAWIKRVRNQPLSCDSSNITSHSLHYLFNNAKATSAV